jgi:hypothetical protein
MLAPTGSRLTAAPSRGTTGDGHGAVSIRDPEGLSARVPPGGGRPRAAEIASHIQGLMRKDIQHFADAVRARGLDPSVLRDRGLSGAEGLLEAVTLIDAKVHAPTS